MNKLIETETWKPVVGYEEYYEVSSLGNVRRKKSGRLRSINYAQTYPTVLLSVGGVHKTFRVHRLVAKAFLPPVEGKAHVNHKDGNHRNNRVDNLEWCTQEENNLHSYRVLNRKPPMLGKKAPNRKVKDEDIKVFYELNKGGMTTDNIGAMYGICGSTIRKHIRKYKAQLNE
ncbi:MAG: NUMOD4 motif-containing HNH endonuclease [Paludibacteraceae bacterium]|nr:NUMOD4 motif-containing HNH endonuclease [Paludibacteraceae bacterium]MBR0065423.1 NUMOD4 motif-containing HNH endonuclease [Paludibacteraceae bacterium]